MIPRYGMTYRYSDLLRAVAVRDAEKALCQALADLHGVRHVILFDAARSALRALLRACGRGGEIIMPGYTCLVVPEAVAAAGCVPVFADVGEMSVNMTPETLSQALSHRSAGVIITHQFGLPSAVPALLEICKQRGLLAIEDAAPALGARINGVPVGRFGDAAVVSFYFTKTVAAGNGGALLTNDDDLADRVTRVIGLNTGRRRKTSALSLASAFGWKGATGPAIYSGLRYARRFLGDERLFQVLPANSAPHAADFPSCAPYTAALLCLELDRLTWNVERRRQLAGLYAAELEGLPGLCLPRVENGVLPAWIQYPVFVPDKPDAYYEALRQSVDLSWTFRYCAAESYGAKNCPNSRYAAQHVLGLPTYPALSDAAAHRITSVLRNTRPKSRHLATSVHNHAVPQ